MRKLFLMLIAVVLISPAMAQDDPAVQILSQTFSRYLVNNVKIGTKGIRFLETTGKLQRGMTMQLSVSLNKQGKVEDVLVNRGVNEIFDDYFRTALFLMPKEEFQDVTIKDVKSYIPIILDLKLSACDTKLADKMENTLGKSKRWKKFKLEDPKLINKFPELAQFMSTKDKCNSSVWYIYFRLMNLKVTIPDVGLATPENPNQEDDSSNVVSEE